MRFHNCGLCLNGFRCPILILTDVCVENELAGWRRTQTSVQLANILSLVALHDADGKGLRFAKISL